MAPLIKTVGLSLIAILNNKIGSFIFLVVGTTLLFHYHPGEEFIYMLDGSSEILLEENAHTSMRAGERVIVQGHSV